jgi:hypothetical protein
MESSSEILGWTGEAILTWTNSGIKLRQGHSLNAIVDFEEQLNFQFPQDFKELYQKVNGFEDFEWNKHMFSLWSLDRILKEFQEDDNNNYVGFCDYLISSHSIGFFKTEEGVFKSYDQTKPIAKTFKASIDLINLNSDLLLMAIERV